MYYRCIECNCAKQIPPMENNKLCTQCGVEREFVRAERVREGHDFGATIVYRSGRGMGFWIRPYKK